MRNLFRLALHGSTVGCLVLAAACSGSDNPNSSSSTMTMSGTGTTGIATDFTASAGTSSSGTTDSDTFGSSSSGATTMDPNMLNCKFVDFVFAVDNSKSMADEQVSLVAAVPGFVDAMQNALPTVENFRVGVIDSDTFPGIGSVEEPLDGCPDGVDCSTCDYTLGSFLTKPLSAEDSATSCNFSTGLAYMDGDSPAFADEFECAALVGTSGNAVEQQIGALTEALGPDLNAPGGCNDEFVRDNALLVFLVITDEEDDNTFAPPPQGGSLGDPERWYDAVIEAKGGKATNAVALTLIGGSPKHMDCPDLANNVGAEETPRIQQFVDKFETNFVGNVCADGYDTFFDEALKKVSEGCQKFIP